MRGSTRRFRSTCAASSTGALRTSWHAASTSTQIDVIVCANGYALLYALIASRRARRPVRLVEVFHTTGFAQPVVSRLRMLLNRFLFRRCELVIYVSHKQREYWRAHGLRVKRDIVIQNGIDADYFTDRSTAQQRAATRAEFGFAPSDFVDRHLRSAARRESSRRPAAGTAPPARFRCARQGADHRRRSAARRDRAPDRCN